MIVNNGFVEIGILEADGAIIEIQDGNHGEKHPKSSDYVEDGIPFIMANNVAGNSLDIEGAAKLPPTIAENLRIGFAKSGDVLLTHKGTVGNTAVVDTIYPYLMLTPQVTYYRTNPKKLINRYLMYAFQDPMFQKTMASLAQQGTRLYIGITAQRKLKIRWKSIEEQNNVISYLAPIDDLIENNRRRIALLEQAARLLYKEWFVHLRFPGHEHGKIKDGVPKGWCFKCIGELTTKISSGSTPRGGAASYKSEGITLIRSLNVYDYQFEESGLAFIDEEQAEKLSNVIVEQNDILLNITGASVGRCCMVPERHLPARVNQHVMIIRANNDVVGPYYLLCAINDNQQKQMLLNIARSGGATREALTKDVVSGLKIPIPAKSLMDAFNENTGDLFKLQQILANQNTQLAKARDLLLPRLMNGEIVV